MPFVSTFGGGSIRHLGGFVTAFLGISLNYQGGSGGATSLVQRLGTFATMPTPTQSGYNFLGWYDAVSGGNKVADAGATYLVLQPKTLYAQWAVANYTVTYNNNGGTGGSASASIAIGSSGTLPSPTQANYSLNGWYTAASGGTFVGTGGASYTPTANVTLYAQWISANYTITYSNNFFNNQLALDTVTYGTSQYDPSPVTVAAGNTTMLPGANFAYSYGGFYFGHKGWYDAASGGNRVGPIGGIYTPTSSTTLYSQWDYTFNQMYYAAHGGGGGGANGGGGGGGVCSNYSNGGYLGNPISFNSTSNADQRNFSGFTKGNTYQIVVGAGGAGGVGTNNGYNGGDSYIYNTTTSQYVQTAVYGGGNLIAYGGGAGNNQSRGTGGGAGPGGSGGVSIANNSIYRGSSGGNALYDGGGGYACGGGGGVSGPGGDGTIPGICFKGCTYTNQGGNGGSNASWEFWQPSGVIVNFSGGGNGGGTNGNNPAANGISGGNVVSGSSYTGGNADSGVSNSAQGGGGNINTNPGFSGGSGCVFIGIPTYLINNGWITGPPFDAGQRTIYSANDPTPIGGYPRYWYKINATTTWTP